MTVTATLAARGWVAGDDAAGVDARRRRRRRRITVTFEAVSCTPVTPVDPTVMQATCAAGVVTVPTITPATTPAGSPTWLDPAGPYVGTVDDDGDGDGDVGGRVGVGDADAGGVDAGQSDDGDGSRSTLVGASCTCGDAGGADGDAGGVCRWGVDGADVDVADDDGDHLYGGPVGAAGVCRRGRR